MGGKMRDLLPAAAVLLCQLAAQCLVNPLLRERHFGFNYALEDMLARLLSLACLLGLVWTGLVLLWCLAGRRDLPAVLHAAGALASMAGLFAAVRFVHVLPSVGVRAVFALCLLPYLIGLAAARRRRKTETI